MDYSEHVPVCIDSLNMEPIPIEVHPEIRDTIWHLLEQIEKNNLPLGTRLSIQYRKRNSLFPDEKIESLNAWMKKYMIPEKTDTMTVEQFQVYLASLSKAIEAVEFLANERNYGIGICIIDGGGFVPESFNVIVQEKTDPASIKTTREEIKQHCDIK